MTERHKRSLKLISEADLLRQQGSVEESLERAREAIRLMEAARDEGNLEDARQLHAAYGVLAVTLAQHNQDEESIAWFEKALTAYDTEHPYGGDHKSLSQLASLRHNYAAALTTLNPAESALQLDMALAIKEKLVAEQPDVAMYKVALARTYLSLSSDGSQERIMRSLHRAMVLLTELIAESPEDIELLGMMGQTTFRLGEMLQRSSPSDAINLYSICLSSLGRAAKSKSGIPFALIGIWVSAQTNLAECVMSQGQFDDARKLLEGALGISQNAIQQVPSLDESTLGVVNTRAHLARLHSKTGEVDAGISVAEELAHDTLPRHHYLAARVYAVVAQESEQPAEYQDLAMQLLGRCCSAGYFDTRDKVEEMRHEQDFLPLRDTRQFDELAELCQARLDAAE